MQLLSLAGVSLTALPSGALWWQSQSLLVVSDLHLGKAERMARRGAGLFPPYETDETLARLADDISVTSPARVICLGDSFDDLAAARRLPDSARLRLSSLMAGRDWIWIEGNHDPGPVELGGRHLADFEEAGLVFRHIAEREAGPGEVSGHYHPKARVAGKGRSVTRPCFLSDGGRLILPAYGAYTGGMPAGDVAVRAGLATPAVALLAGPTMVRLPVAVAA